MAGGTIRDALLNGRLSRPADLRDVIVVADGSVLSWFKGRAGSRHAVHLVVELLDTVFMGLCCRLGHALFSLSDQPLSLK